MSKHPLYIIVAVDEANGIGYQGQIPWHLKGDMQFFKKITTETSVPGKQNMVVMGRKTWESLPERFRPLPDRVNVVLSRNHDYKLMGAELFNSLEQVVTVADDSVEKIFVIGGATVYAQALRSGLIDGIYLTRIARKFNCDAAFPEVPTEFKQVKSFGKEVEQGIEYEYLLYTRGNN